MSYVFLSVSNLQGKNLGCCIVKADDCDVRKYFLPDEGFAEEGMELNKFYTREEMILSGHKIETEPHD